MWVNHQTMLINEYRLNPMDPKAKEMIVGELEKFLFGDGSELPADYVPKPTPTTQLTNSSNHQKKLDSTPALHCNAPSKRTCSIYAK